MSKQKWYMQAPGSLCFSYQITTFCPGAAWSLWSCPAIAWWPVQVLEDVHRMNSVCVPCVCLDILYDSTQFCPWFSLQNHSHLEVNCDPDFCTAEDEAQAEEAKETKLLRLRVGNVKILRSLQDWSRIRPWHHFLMALQNQRTSAK